VNLFISSRLDHHSIYGTYISPKIAAIYTVNEKLSIWGGIGSGFRGPSTYYSYNSLAYKVTGGIDYEVVPNPDVEPEILYNGEAGFRWNINDHFRTNATVFYHLLNNNITRSFVELDPEKYPNAVNQFGAEAYVNDDKSEAQLFGIQVNALADNIIDAVELDVDLFISIFNGNEILPNGLGELDSYRLAPRFMGQLNVSLNPFGSVYIFLRNNYSTETYRRFLPLSIEDLESLGYPTTVPGYYTLDFIVRFSFYKNLQAFFQMNNVFDNHYGGIDAYGSQYDLRYNPQYGRGFGLGLSFSLE
jgi:outer membrane receptor for ferrienterochelin and colicin